MIVGKDHDPSPAEAENLYYTEACLGLQRPYFAELPNFPKPSVILTCGVVRRTRSSAQQSPEKLGSLVERPASSYVRDTTVRQLGLVP